MKTERQSDTLFLYRDFCGVQARFYVDHQLVARGHNAGWGFSGDGAFVGFEG